MIDFVCSLFWSKPEKKESAAQEKFYKIPQEVVFLILEKLADEFKSYSKYMETSASFLMVY